jgi:hypothetical protein
MSHTKLSLSGNNVIIITGQGEFSVIPTGDGKTANLFFIVYAYKTVLFKERNTSRSTNAGCFIYRKMRGKVLSIKSFVN